MKKRAVILVICLVFIICLLTGVYSVVTLTPMPSATPSCISFIIVFNTFDKYRKIYK